MHAAIARSVARPGVNVTGCRPSHQPAASAAPIQTSVNIAAATGVCVMNVGAIVHSVHVGESHSSRRDTPLRCAARSIPLCASASVKPMARPATISS